MELRCTVDTSAGDWLTGSGTPAMQLVTFGPAGFTSYARLRFIPDPMAPGQDEADVELADDHLTDLAQVRRALHLLAGFTTTPQECFFCLWEGYSDVRLPPEVQAGRLVEVPHRRYALLRGSLDGIDHWEDDLGGGGPIPPPAFVWPADRRWCLASDVDPHWAGVGGEQAAIDALVGDPVLDVVPARPDDVHPSYGR